MKADVLVVGAGFAGSVMAEQIAGAGFEVILADRRQHIGGNAYDMKDAHGVLVHPYGPHLFHTNAKRVFDYLSQFTDWRPYEHRVLAAVAGQLLPIPINRTTINRLYGMDLDEKGVEEFLQRVREPRAIIRTSEDVVLSSVGSDLCEKFFRGYTRKQWGLDLSELSAGVAARIPTRTNDDDRYFTDEYQAMPSDGYTQMFTRMLQSPRILQELGKDFAAMKDQIRVRHIVYTGPIDEYFSYCYGALPYRSLRFEHLHFADTEYYQAVGTINYPNEHEFTRITEFKHITGQPHTGTSIVREYPKADGDPYYPVPRVENDALYKRYEALAAAERHVTFVGRLAQYKYYNMDQVVAAALKSAQTVVEKLNG